MGLAFFSSCLRDAISCGPALSSTTDPPLLSQLRQIRVALEWDNCLPSDLENTVLASCGEGRRSDKRVYLLGWGGWKRDKLMSNGNCRYAKN